MTSFFVDFLDFEYKLNWLAHIVSDEKLRLEINLSLLALSVNIDYDTDLLLLLLHLGHLLGQLEETPVWLKVSESCGVPVDS